MTNGYMNPVDEENYRRTSDFLPFNRLQTNVSVLILSRRDEIGHRSILALVRVPCIRFKLKIEPGT